MLLASIELTLLRRLVLHCSWGDHQTLSLSMTLLLIVVKFIYRNPWVLLVLIGGRWPRRNYQNRCMRCRDTLFCLRLKSISSTNNPLTIGLIEESGLWCKIVPRNASKSLRRAIKIWMKRCSSLRTNKVQRLGALLIPWELTGPKD